MSAPSPSPLSVENPDDYRMTVGEHLEELRRRLIFSLVGFVVVLVGCLFFSKDVMAYFCKPLFVVLIDNEINPQMYFTDLSEPFMVYMKIAVISALTLSSPWIVTQIWLFVAAGLYPRERKTITRYVPLSLGLLTSGLLFVYFLVLPWTIQFFMAFNISIPLPAGLSQKVTTPAPTTLPDGKTYATHIQPIAGDPAAPDELQWWFDTTQHRIKVFVGGKIRTINFAPENLAAPMITISDYVDLVFGMLLTFGLSFQLPLVVLAAVTAGIVTVTQLRAMRRITYLVMAIVASVITPGDVITATIALMFPLIGLYELGIFLARRTKPADDEEDAESLRDTAV